MRPIYCLSTADWDAPLWTNKQHLMSRLADRGVKIVYVDSPGHRAPAMQANDIARIIGRVSSWRPMARTIRQNLYRDSPLTIPAHGRQGVDSLNEYLLRNRTSRNLRYLQLKKPVLWTYTPVAMRVWDPSLFAGVVYHCVDDLANYPGVNKAFFRAEEERLVKIATRCIASSRPLQSRLVEMGGKEVLYWPNPADTAAFRLAGEHSKSSSPDQITVGFVGAVQSHKVNIPLIKACAIMRPDWKFIIAGPIGLGMREDEKIDGLPGNVFLPGLIERSKVPELVSSFSVGWIPYRINEYTASVYPMKIHEYLSAGLPVVTTSLKSLIGEVNNIRFADTPEETIDAIEKSLSEESENPDIKRQRISTAADHSWESRVDQALRLLTEFD